MYLAQDRITLRIFVKAIKKISAIHTSRQFLIQLSENELLWKVFNMKL